MITKRPETKVSIDGEDIELKSFVFSGGEVQVRLCGCAPSVFSSKPDSYLTSRLATVTSHIFSANQLMETLLVLDALDFSYHPHIVELIIPYLPYSRQDRVCYPGESFALRVIGKMLDRSNVSKIITWDVHSPAAIEHVPNLTSVPASEFFSKFPVNHTDVLVAPDAGAVSRVWECCKTLGNQHMIALKKRSPEDGSLAITDMTNISHIGDRDFIIVDDICDGGRTFVNLARELRAFTNGKIRLYVTHGIFSNGFDDLLKHIDEVWVANPWPSLELPEQVRILPQ